jgi:hypothetical protein
VRGEFALFRDRVLARLTSAALAADDEP